MRNRLKSNGQLDFSNPESVQQLTKSLLKRDFGLKISLPPDRLCPPVSCLWELFLPRIFYYQLIYEQVPNRLNYLLWIQGLLDTTSDSYADTYDPEREVLGLDIGTGASCIYPMLGCAQRPNWRFAGTGTVPTVPTAQNSNSTNVLIATSDIDEKSMQFAKTNVQQNGLQNRIKLLQTQKSDPLLPLDIMKFEK